MLIKRILVPTDFSATSDAALEYAIDLARRLDASIRLIHVVEEPSLAVVYPDAYFVDLPGLRMQAAQAAQKHFEEYVTRLGFACTTDVQFGRPAAAIIEQAAAQGTDLIVMGTHGRGALGHLMMGNVAERVVRTAPCPVLTVGPRCLQREAVTAPVCAVAAE